MNDKVKNRDRRVTIRLTEQEYGKIHSQWTNSTCRKLADFIRRRLFGKAIVTTYRNRSLDDFMAEMVQLRRELNSIGNNFNQAVHKLHMSDTDAEVKMWLRIFKKDRLTLLNHTEKIKEKINSIADQWLQ
ncbi:plasmid mobilization protein [Olivibacter domesticus]|uniref:Mobilisation protein (MobC) n=1 Tax=Olivibacter domesticus TaxID=407022 RepID=A0A1H7IGE3_OLID1|nr:plasmid mobilization relaxosome protein MobC [Olivibacter domesticus]SEK60922.1 hypothetical protein SAMN05661044_00676 [Olivibacter domesticus]